MTVSPTSDGPAAVRLSPPLDSPEPTLDLTAPHQPERHARRAASLRTLVWRGFHAMRHPYRTFQTIPEGERVPLARLLLLMAVWGAVYALLHFRALERTWLWNGQPSVVRCRILAFMLASPGVWLLGSFGLWQCARWLKRPIALERAEIAAVCLWLVWALMPVVDLVHWIGWRPWRVQAPLPFGLHASFIAHAAWGAAFPLLLVELAAFFRSRLGDGRRLLTSAVLSVGMVLAARGLGEPVAELLALTVRRVAPAHAPGYWWIVAVGWGVFLSLGLAWRSVARGGTVRRAMALAALALLAVMVLARLLWYPQ